MSCLVSVEYSPVCATDKSVYSEYLQLYGRYLSIVESCCRDGQRFDEFGRFRDRGGVGARCCGSGDLGGCIVGDASGGSYGSAQAMALRLTSGCGVGDGIAVSGVDHAYVGGEEVVVGVSAGVVGDGGGGLVNDVVREHGNASCDKVVTELAGSVSGKHARKNRMRKMRNKARRASVSSTGGDSVGVAESKGFWGSCSPETRQSLIDSKARMHISDNERRIAENNRRIAKIGSREAVVADVVALVERARALGNASAGAKVIEWAESEFSDCAESLAKSATGASRSFEAFSDVAVSDSVSQVNGKGALVEKEIVYVDRVVEKLVEKEVVKPVEKVVYIDKPVVVKEPVIRQVPMAADRLSEYERVVTAIDYVSGLTMDDKDRLNVVAAMSRYKLCFDRDGKKKENKKKNVLNLFG